MALAATVLLSSSSPLAQGRGETAAPPSPRVAAPLDLTGYWVAVISEDWRWRMITPPKGDYASIPLTVEGKRAADSWNPARDEAAGEQCRAYGAPGVMRGPTRLRVSWLDDDTLKVETDYGIQTRLLDFRRTEQASAPPSWQGLSTAQWILSAGRGSAGRFGSMKAITTRLRPGYLRKNGVPYSGRTVLTEYWSVYPQENGTQYLVVTSVVDDPVNLQLPWITSLNFKKETDGSKWDPTPCSTTF
jgi:hypothetical protein